MNLTPEEIVEYLRRTTMGRLSPLPSSPGEAEEDLQRIIVNLYVDPQQIPIRAHTANVPKIRK